MPQGKEMDDDMSRVQAALLDKRKPRKIFDAPLAALAAWLVLACYWVALAAIWVMS